MRCDRRSRVRTLLGIVLGLGLCAAASAAEREPLRTGAPPPSAGGLTAEVTDRFRAALGAFKGGDWQEAAREFGDRDWAATPLAEYARLYQAESQVRAGDVALARAGMLRAADAMAEGRLAPSALLEAATLLSSVGESPTAATLLRHIVDRHGDHPEAPRARLLLGRALLAEGRIPEAARVFSDLWRLSPAAPEADSGARELQALADRGVPSVQPSVPERLERAERLEAGAQAKREAEALLGAGLSTDLRGRAFKVVLNASRRAGQHDAALAAVTRALAELPAAQRPPWLIELARIQQRRTRDLALGTLDKLVQEYPTSREAGEALLQKARLLEAAGKLPEAQAVYGKLAAERPDAEEGGRALWRLGWLAWWRGAYGEAAGMWARLLTIRGGQADREAATYWLGRADERRGEGELAARRFAELQGAAPRSYYGVLAAQRSGQTGPHPVSSAPVPLPSDPLESLQADAGYRRIEALRAVGLGTFADEDMAEMTRRSLGEPRVLYGLAAAYARESRYHLALRILRRHFFSVARSEAGPVPRAFWEMFYPLGWRGELTEAASRAGIDAFLVAAVVREESSFYPRARSHVGARGLMQLMPDTARPLARERRLAFNDGELLDDPGANLELGTAFLGTLLREFGDARLAAAAYNAGPSRVRGWWAARRSEDLEAFVEEIPFNETRAFVKRVMLAWAEYRRLYGTAAVEAAASGSP